MTLSRTLTATAGFGALALVAGGAALAAASSAASPSRPTAWTAAGAPSAQVHLVSGSTESGAPVDDTPPAAAATTTTGTTTTGTTSATGTSTATTSSGSGPAAPALVAATSTATSAPAVTTEESPEHERCEATLPAVVVGDPGTRAGADSGFRVWHDGSGWHLRATHPGDAAVPFSGVIHSGQPVTATGFRLEKGDTMTVSADRHTVTFALVNHGGLDGIDFTDRCAIHTSFTLRREGHQVSATSIYLGARGGHPTSNPFQVERRRH